MTTAHSATERPARAFPAPNALVGVGLIVIDDGSADRSADGSAHGEERVLLGLGHDGRWELPGGKVDPGESFEQAGVRELAEETGLLADPEEVRIVAVLMDEQHGITRLSAAALVPAATATATVTEPDKIVRWQWFPPHAIPGRLFAPSAAVLRAWRPELALPADASHRYPTA